MFQSTERLATWIVAATGVLWGFYWLPVRQLQGLGLQGGWGTFAIVAAATVVLAPFAFAGRAKLRAAPGGALAFVMIGGGAFALYSIALVHGRVAIVILLFFLTPVWSVILARFIMGWAVPRLRLVAIALGLLGLAIMLGGDGGVPAPRGLGEWLALISGMLWSVATTGIRSQPEIPAQIAAFLFAFGATVCALGMALFSHWPGAPSLPAIGLAVLTGALWWGVSMAGLIWATARLDPARVGILLMAEVLVGAVSAAVLAGELLGPLEIIGGAFVVAAGVVELWPMPPRRDLAATTQTDR